MKANSRPGLTYRAGVDGGCECSNRAFTLIELLVVIAIIGILAAIAGPTLSSFKPNAMAAATQQLLGDIGRARQLAMSERTTVYMVFVPTNFYAPGYAYQLVPAEQNKAEKLLDKQLIGYNFVALRSVGEQPGVSQPRYLSSWKTLPEGVFISLFAFSPRYIGGAPNPFWITNPATGRVFEGLPMTVSTNLPFPSEMAPKPYNLRMPYLAFNYLGQLESKRDEIIPLSRGTVLFGRDFETGTKLPTKTPPSFQESPPGNCTNSAFNLLYIDWLTGRAHVERQEIK